MKKTHFSKICLLLACLVLIAAVALVCTSCNDKTQNDPYNTPVSDGQKTVLGQGETTFNFSVKGPDGAESHFEIRTDKSTVGEALLELGVIDGEQGPYGLYVKKVDGIELDYDKDGKYWAFYINGAYAMSGVDQTEIVKDAHYSFVAE